jgi:phosphoglucosamine mutase
MVMGVMMDRKVSLATLASEVRIYPQLLRNVRVADKQAVKENAAVQDAVKAVTSALGDNGRILVRESGTEPVIRVMVEAETDEICKKYVELVIDVIRAQGLAQ